MWGATEGGLKALCPKVFCGYYQRTGVRIGVKLWASTKKIIVFVFLRESHVNLFFLLHFFSYVWTAQGERKVLVVEVWSGEERTCGHRCELLQGTCVCVGVCGTCGFVWVGVRARTH